MKKAGFFFLLLFLFLVPARIEASGIERFYMNTTVLENGDIEVEEFFDMAGNYNGFERIINYKNISASAFDKNASSFGGSDIHNGSGILISEVGAVTLSEVQYSARDMKAMFASIKEAKESFTKIESHSGKSGDYGVYELATTLSGSKVKIYNPKETMGFYMKYTLQNMGIVHNDVAEIGYNIFSNELTESIDDFRLHITIPNNKEEIRAWAHGPLNGNIALDGKDKIDVQIQGLNASTAMDVRFVFDKTVLTQSQKVTEVNALEPILAYEKVQAEQANEKREEAKAQIERENRVAMIYTMVSVLWVVGLGLVTYKVYQKYDKEYASSFKGKYFRDFPSDLSPEIVGYLMRQKIGVNDLSASILNLIYKKKIGYEKIDAKNYKLIDKGNRDNLSLSEERIFSLLFPERETETTLKDFQKRAKSNYENFISNYHEWASLATSEAKGQDFFEKKRGKVTGPTLYASVGIFMNFYFFGSSNKFWFLLFMLVGFGVVIYYSSFSKRTIKGNEEYRKWNGLKNFINDFGQFKQRELPHIELWEKYLVYAVEFGIAEKLAKQMELKIQEYNMDSANMPYGHRSDYFTNMLIFNRIMSRSVSTSYSSALSAQQIANSSSSSSGGFGGGFSGGGGSFGGGGGGGRF